MPILSVSEGCLPTYQKKPNVLIRSHYALMQHQAAAPVLGNQLSTRYPSNSALGLENQPIHHNR